MAFRFKLTFAFVVGWAATASAQRMITLNPVQLSGSIVQVSPQSIAIKAANGQNWTLKLQQGKTKVKISGSAEPEMLTPGTCVRFTASIDKRTCKGQEKIDKITMFTQTPGVTERTLGVELESEHPQANENEANAGAPPAADREPAPKPGRARGPGAKGPKLSVPDVAAYDVCAQIVSCRGGRLIVSVQNRFFKPKITVELSADAQIGLDLGNLSLAKPGDKISATGYYIAPGICEVTNSVEVALTNPLAPPGSHSHRARPAPRGSDASRRPGGKAKPVAADDTATTEKVPAKEPAEVEAPAMDMPPEKDDPPATTEPETKPEPKKVDEKPEKKPAVPDDEKDVFEK